MALVDYASSDDESCDESEVVQEKEDQNEKKQVLTSAETMDSVNGDGELFSSLPRPKKEFSFLEDDNKLSKLLLNKTHISPGKTKNVKISVPSISEFDAETEEPVPKKLKPSSKGTGLFSILPPPKNNSVKLSTTNLVPHPVSQKQSGKKSLTKKLMKAAEPKEDDDDDDDDVSVGNSFFGSSLVENPFNSESGAVNSESTLYNDTFDRSAPSGNYLGGDVSNTCKQNSSRSVSINANESKPIYSTNASEEPEPPTADDNPLDLDEKALQILCGNKKKRHQMPMNIIDLSGEEVLPDSKEWLLKQFTEEKRGRGLSHKKTHGPSSMSRRKHQITYLAYQAKEMELELQNQWANNRMTRKQTQAKYGF